MLALGEAYGEYRIGQLATSIEGRGKLKCPRCGNENDNSDGFCGVCGQSLSTPPSNPPVPQGYPPVQQYSPAKPETVGFFIASMVLGICSIFPFYVIGIVLGVLAIIFWVIGNKKLQENPLLKGKGMGMAGLVCGIIGAVICVVFWLIVIISSGHLFST